jgi:hypothetical protein
MGNRYMFFVMPIAGVVVAQCLWNFSELLGSYLGGFLQSKVNFRNVISGILVFTLFLSSVINSSSYIGINKSSVRPLIQDLQRGIYPASPASTLYLSVPDVLGITVGYYHQFHTLPDSELGQASFYGFPHWQNPELHQPSSYYKAWRDVDIVPNTLRNIDLEHKQGKRYLGLLYSDGISQLLQPQYLAKVDNLIGELRQRYPIIQQKKYSTKKRELHDVEEEFTFYLLDLESPRS